MKQSFLWNGFGESDGVTVPVIALGSQLYTSVDRLSARTVYEAKQYNIPVPKSPRPLSEQYGAAVFELNFKLFNDVFVYDPELRFEVLFADPEGQDLAWVAAPVVCGLALIGGFAAAVFVSPKLRAKVMPFSVRSTETNSVSIKPSPSQESLVDNTWVPQRATGVPLNNVK